MSRTILPLLVLLPEVCSALVEYSRGDKSYRPSTSAQVRRNPPSRPSRGPAATSVSRKLPWRSPRMFEVSLGHRSIKAERAGALGRVNLTEMEGLLKTPYNVFLFASHRIFRASKTHWQGGRQGNTISGVGMNWLRFGTPEDRVTVDLLAALSWARDDSDFASSRSDKIITLSSEKRFFDFSLGLTGEFQLTGTPGLDEETAVGTIRKLSAFLEWRAGNEIAFVLAGSNCHISSYKKDDHRRARLRRPVDFGHLSGILKLRLSSGVRLDLAANFPRKKARDKDLVGARLWHLPGLYGNSLSAKLSFGL